MTWLVGIVIEKNRMPIRSLCIVGCCILGCATSGHARLWRTAIREIGRWDGEFVCVKSYGSHSFKKVGIGIKGDF